MRVTIKLKIFLFLILFILTKQIEIYAILMLFAIIHELGQMTGKTVSKEKEDKIIQAVVNDQVPKDLDKML